MLALADTAANDVSAVGMWVLGASAVLGLTLIVKQLFWPAKPLSEAYVTKAEMHELRTELLGRMDTLDRSGAVALAEIRKDVQDRFDRIEKYQHESSHRTAGAQQDMLLKLERLLTLEAARHGRLPTFTNDPDPEINKPL